MFESLQSRLGAVFDRLRGRGVLSEEDVSAALREIRIALLEADVALPVVKEFVSGVRERAVGHEVLKSITPGQQVVKIVNDHLIELLGGSVAELDLAGSPPTVILMTGLQGSGKTTSSAKIARRLSGRDNRRVLLASLDVQRPAAQQQLEILAGQAKVASLPIVAGQKPLDITRRALETARREGYDVVVLDTAGRLSIDDALMSELAGVRDFAKPHETLLVADALTGQDAVNTAKAFNERIGITGIVLTRMDGDARGGAALSMRHVTGKPIKLVGMGEKLDALEAFHPERVANRILGMGDIVSLVEKAAETIDKDEAEKVAKKLAKGSFDMNDLKSQLMQMRKMGGMSGILGKLPGIGKMQAQLKDANVDDKMVTRQIAIIDSMTKVERKNPLLVNGSRRKRIARGSGAEVQDVNRLLKQHRQMQDMMKKMKKSGGLKGMMGGRGFPGGMPPGLPPGLIPR